MQNNFPHIEIIDTFCGAGGTTEGFERAEYLGEKIATVISCINHDEVAIASHAANHCRAKHFIEDVKNFDVSRFPRFSDNAISVLHASLECTNFSNAKGGKPRDPDSRTQANYLFPYIEHLNPDYITIENVREFMSWGDLDENGKPVSRDKGRLFREWVNRVKEYGYDVDWRLLNSADFGAYTSRTRLFIIFAKKGFPIRFPEPTHSKTGGSGTSDMPKWKAVKDVLDFSDEGVSIFERKKPLSEKTLERIYAGLKKFIPDNDNFIIQYNSGSNSNRCLNLDKPCNVVPTNNRFGLVNVKFLVNYNHSSKVNPTDKPAPTILTRDKLALVNPEFLIKYHGNGKNTLSVDGPCSTLSTKDRVALIKPGFFIAEQYGRSKGVSAGKPLGSITRIPKQNIVRVEQAFLMNRQFNNKGNSIENPAPTLIATMGKRPQYLVLTEQGELAIKINRKDSKATKLIKRFMADNGIIDVKMRMLRVPELLKIQGFPDDYILKGNQTEQKKFIGNSVVPVVAKKIIEALYETIIKQRKVA